MNRGTSATLRDNTEVPFFQKLHYHSIVCISPSQHKKQQINNSNCITEHRFQGLQQEGPAPLATRARNTSACFLWSRSRFLILLGGLAMRSTPVTWHMYQTPPSSATGKGETLPLVAGGGELWRSRAVISCTSG